MIVAIYLGREIASASTASATSATSIAAPVTNQGRISIITSRASGLSS